MPEGTPVLYQKQDILARITFNRPAVRNALDHAALHQLLAALTDIEADREVRAVILTGAGDKAFSAGADIEYLSQASPLEIRELARLAVSATHKIEALGKPVVAAINGYALGGGLELAEACCLRVAARHAQLGHPEVRIGAVAGWGGTTRLPRLIGRGRAAELLLTGKMISAEQAQAWGLVNVVTDAADLLNVAEDLTRDIAAQAPVAVRLTWEALHRGGNLTLEESAFLGADFFGLVATTEDFKRGTRAFIEKSSVVYRGE